MKKLQEMFPQNTPSLLEDDLNTIRGQIRIEDKKIVFIPDFIHDYYILGYYYAPLKVYPYTQHMDLKDTYIFLFKKSEKINLLVGTSLKVVAESKYFIVYEIN